MSLWGTFKGSCGTGWDGVGIGAMDMRAGKQNGRTTMNRVQPFGTRRANADAVATWIVAVAGLVGLVASGHAAGARQFPGENQPNQWETRGNPGANPLMTPSNPNSVPTRPTPVSPAPAPSAPPPAIGPNAAPPAATPVNNQWDVRGNPGANPMISPNPTFPVTMPGSTPSVPPAQWHPSSPLPHGWGYYPWGGYTVLWNGSSRVVYWNGYQIPAFIPRPFGGVVYLYDPNLIPGATRPSAEAQKPPPAPEPTPFERGLIAFRNGRSADATKIWRDLVQKDHEDFATMRLLALALLENREADNAAAMMRQAYRADPTLASRELDTDLLNLTSARRASLVNRAVEYANRVGSASSWLNVTVLMQTDRRFELARKQLKKAADEGLEPDVRAALDAALASKIRQPAVKPVIKPSSPGTTPSPTAPAAPTTATPANGTPTK